MVKVSFKIVANYILILLEKIRFDISYESSAFQMIHKKCLKKMNKLYIV